MGPRHHLSFCACNTAWLASELLVSMGPNPYLWFLHAKQRLLEQNYEYLCVTALICGFCIHNSAFWTRISSLYGSQTSSVVLSTHNCVLNTRIKRLYVFQPSPVVLCMQHSDFSTWIASLYRSQTSYVLFFCMQNSAFWTRITNLYGSQTSPVVLCMQYSVITTRITCLYGSKPYLWFLHSKQRLLDSNNKSLRVPDNTCRFVHAIQRD